MSLRYAFLLAGLGAFSSGSAMATPTTFAQYFQTNGAQQDWTITTSGDQTSVSATGSVLFFFSGITGLPFTAPEVATFTLTATTTQPGSCSVSCGPGDGLVQPGYSGTFSFIDQGSAPGSNLLSGTFEVTGSPSTTGAQFSSSVGGTGGSFNASATAGNLNQLVLTSAYISFPGATNETASFSLSSLIPNFSTGPVTGNQAYPAGTDTASGSGTFSSDPVPVADSIPEPASLLLLGAGTVGIALARRTPRAA